MARPTPIKAGEALDTKDVAEAFSAVFKLGVGVFANPAYSTIRPAGAWDTSLFDQQFVIPLANGETSPHTTPAGVLSDIVWLRQEQLLGAITQCEIPDEWPAGGLFDIFVLAVLEPMQKALSVAVDAGFTKPFGCEETEEIEVAREAQAPRDVAWLL